MPGRPAFQQGCQSRKEPLSALDSSGLPLFFLACLNRSLVPAACGLPVLDMAVLR
jgi:hypothetical protein